MTLIEKIRNELYTEINSDMYSVHDKFLSEKKLAVRFQCSEVTVGKAINRLVNEGLLYRKRPNGTFIAPRSKNKMLLLVMPSDNISLLRFCRTANLENSQFYLNEMVESDFLKKVDDLEYYYPNIAGILFYRDPRRISPHFETLREKNIPFIFVGSSAHAELLHDVPTIFYDEEQIVDLAMSALRSDNCKKIGLITNRFGWATTDERQNKYLKYLQDNSLPLNLDIVWVQYKKDSPYMAIPDMVEWLTPIIDKVDGFFAVADTEAALLACVVDKIGLTVGKDIKIVGVNNERICDIVYPGISSVEVPTAENSQIAINLLMNIIENNPCDIKLESKLNFIERGSCKYNKNN